MATNKLMPESDNALEKLQSLRGDDKIRLMRQIASEQPQYQELADYLMARSAMPPVKEGYLPADTNAQYSRNSFFGSGLPATGEVTINYGTNDPRSLIHELTHAAHYQMGRQYRQQDVKDAEAKQRFKDAYDRLLRTNEQGPGGMFAAPTVFQTEAMASRLAPDWAKQNSRYRASVSELPAFAMGNQGARGAPAHVDPTLSTEFRVLLDMALRDAQANPYKTTR
jgi:hypothetical protein